MLKKNPFIKYLKLNIHGKPPVLENTSQMITDFGLPLDKSAPFFNLMVMWEFKCYDYMNNSKLLIDCLVCHEHQFQKFIPVSPSEVEKMILTSFNESNDVFEKELKKDKITYRASPLPADSLIYRAC